MKKKLKVKKAFLGKMMKAAPAQAKRVLPSKPLINLFKPQQPTPPRPMQQPLPSKPLINLFKPQPSPGFTPIGVFDKPLVNAVGPKQTGTGQAISTNLAGDYLGYLNGGTGGPRPGVQPLPAAPGPLGGQVTQPVPAMKKGGMVRGQGAAIRGTKFKGIF